MSARHPTAAQKRTSPHFAYGPIPDVNELRLAFASHALLLGPRDRKNLLNVLRKRIDEIPRIAGK